MNEKLGVLHALKLRWYHDRFRESENIQNVAVTQIVAGLLTFAIQVYLFYTYDRDEKAESHAVVVFVLGIFAITAGIFGCVYNGRQLCIRIIYLSSCVLELVAAAIVLFMTFCWGFLTAIRRAQSDDIHRPLSLSDSSIHISDELHFWLKCALFMCIIIASLFTLTGFCLTVSWHRQRKDGYYPTSDLDRELLPL